MEPSDLDIVLLVEMRTCTSRATSRTSSLHSCARTSAGSAFGSATTRGTSSCPSRRSAASSSRRAGADGRKHQKHVHMPEVEDNMLVLINKHKIRLEYDAENHDKLDQIRSTMNDINSIITRRRTCCAPSLAASAHLRLTVLCFVDSKHKTTLIHVSRRHGQQVSVPCENFDKRF